MMPICNMIIKAFINLFQSSSLENNNMTVRIKNAMPITKKKSFICFWWFWNWKPKQNIRIFSIPFPFGKIINHVIKMNISIGI